MMRIFSCLLLCYFCVTDIFAVELLSKEQAVKRMFLTAESVNEEVKSLTPAQLDKVKKYLGGKLWAIKPTDGVSESNYSFYIGIKAGQQTGVALIEEQEDKWGPLTFIIVLDPVTGKVTNAAMMKYIDGRARNLSNRAFLKSYFDKGIDDPITVGKDIDAVSGATVSRF
jgi:hypothetical protein